MAAGGVCGAGGVTEPAQMSTSPTGQLCQLWPCGDRKGSWGAQPEVGLGPCVCVVGVYLESVLGTVGRGIGSGSGFCFLGHN